MREVLVLASSSLLFLNWLDSSCTILPASRLEHMPVIVLVFQLGGRGEDGSLSIQVLAVHLVPLL